MKSVGVGYGKAILFGEHFVVYDVPAIAAGLELKTKTTVKDSDKTVIYDKTLR